MKKFDWIELAKLVLTMAAMAVSAYSLGKLEVYGRVLDYPNYSDTYHQIQCIQASGQAGDYR